jgi:hypothetical protein
VDKLTKEEIQKREDQCSEFVDKMDEFDRATVYIILRAMNMSIDEARRIRKKRGVEAI